MLDLFGRGRGIRTPGPLLPKQVLYQAELCPDPFYFKELEGQQASRFYMFPRKFYMSRRVDALFQAPPTVLSAARRARQCA